MNNVGEFFFSAPIDPFDVWKDWGRSDNDQRHRLAITGTLNVPRGPARSAWERIVRGFQLSGMLQAYSSLPFNITSGVTTLQGTQGRPVVNGQSIPRNAGSGSDYLAINARIARTFAVAGARVEGAVEAFNITNRRNDLMRNGNFGTGAYPVNPSPSFNQITAVADPRSIQFVMRVRF
jgi:hypothetical protein